MSGENFGFHKWRVLLEASCYRSEVLLHILKYIGHTNKKELSPRMIILPRLRDPGIVENMDLESDLDSSPK